jgi:hypothetical protein
MQITQTFKFKKDCKGSVTYEPTIDTPTNPAICTAIYINRRYLPNSVAVPTIELTLDVPSATVQQPQAIAQ